MTVTKRDIVEEVRRKLGPNYREANRLVDAFFHEICEQLAAGHEVRLSGFGNFKLHDKRARPGRNPQTNEVVQVSARRVVSFNAGQKLRKRMNEVSTE